MKNFNDALREHTELARRQGARKERDKIIAKYRKNYIKEIKVIIFLTICFILAIFVCDRVGYDTWSSILSALIFTAIMYYLIS